MNLRWLKDFLAVAEFGSFSRAAEVRAITQPAMSRHIKGLEDRLGFKLIDRTNFPATLTPEGEKFRQLAGDVMVNLDQGINEIKQHVRQHRNALRFSMQHVLAAEFFSHWWHHLGQGNRSMVQVEANNLHDCVQRLENGHCDFMICYHHPAISIELDPAEFEAIKIGQDTLVPVSALSKNGGLTHDLNGAMPVSVAGSATTDFMGKVVEHILNRNDSQDRIQKVYEDSFSEGVKSQALLGTGLAWLPLMLVQQEIDDGRLTIIGGDQWQQQLQIFLYCRPDGITGGAQDVWQRLRSH